MKKIKNITAAEILKQIKLTVICGEEIEETNVCDGFSTWMEQFDASNPYEAFTPESREYFQNKLFVAFAAGMLPAEVTETRTNEVGPDGCWVFTVDTTGTLNPYEETEEETEETETAAPSAPSANEETTAHTEEHPTETTDTEEEEEEQTMNTNTKKISFEIRQLDAWGNNEEGYDINESWHMGEMTTKAQNERKAFTSWLKNHCGISFKNNRTLIEFDGDCYTIIDRKTKEPLFIAIPQY